MKTTIELFLQKENSETGKRLKDERVRLGFNQAEFAERLGIHKNTQRNYEAGKRIPTVQYYENASKLGVNIPYVVTGETIMEFPGKVSNLASLVFKKSNSGQFPEAMEALFYILGLNMINEETIKEYKGLSSDNIDLLIKTAFERGEEFSEAYRAISLYLLNSDAVSMDSYGNWNLILLTDLIFKTLNLYDQIKDHLLISLHDNIRLVAEQIIKSYEKEHELRK